MTLRAHCITATQAQALATDGLPSNPPPQGFLWIACTREWLAQHAPVMQTWLAQVAGAEWVDLHLSDLLNPHLPSRFDASTHYDVLVFRRLSTRPHNLAAATAPPPAQTHRRKRPGPPVLQRIDTSPVGFAVFDRVLISVHPSDCAELETYAQRLLAQSEPHDAPDTRSAGARGLPTSSADMMLRIISQMVDGYLDLRRELSRQLDHWQSELLQQRTRFARWDALLQARAALHQLDALCDDQRTALDAWLASLGALPPSDAQALREWDVLRIRARDVLEHIERVAQHVRRLEHNTETALQMHFSMQSHRTNDVMRTLTVLTAIFLPLNLIAGIFGMNFEFMPWLGQASAFWWTLAGMLGIAALMGLVFWRKRYLADR